MLKTENVLFVMTDGLRWQEVFRGADDALLTKENGVSDEAAVRRRFGQAGTLARQTALMPFLWNTVVRDGQIYGDRDRGGDAHVTNGLNFSYPGYNETLCGFPDPRINSNDKKYNPNVTVLEWLSRKRAFNGRVAAFGAWDAFPYILNAPRAQFLVNAGFDPLTTIVRTPTIDLLNRLKAETPSAWGEEPYDSLTFHTALEYLKARKPRVLFLSLGETDEWAHGGKYVAYLEAAQRVDTYLKTLWETVQSIGQYRNKTTLIISVDHGRGEAANQAWRSHGTSVAGSEAIWMAYLGPDTPPLAEQTARQTVTQSQIAATLAALLSEDYRAAVPRAGAPLPDVIAGGKTIR